MTANVGKTTKDFLKAHKNKRDCHETVGENFIANENKPMGGSSVLKNRISI